MNLQLVSRYTAAPDHSSTAEIQGLSSVQDTGDTKSAVKLVLVVPAGLWYHCRETQDMIRRYYSAKYTTTLDHAFTAEDQRLTPPSRTQLIHKSL